MSATIRIIGPRSNYTGSYINTTSRSNNWSKGLSPFYLGPVRLYNGYIAINVENAWQYSKLYKEYADENGNPTKEYFYWAQKGWSKNYADRYPMGKGRKPLCSIWRGNKYSYIESRKRIYIPLYSKAVVKSKAFEKLKNLYNTKKEIVLWDFDGYDYIANKMTFHKVINNPNKKMGHAFVLAMLLLGY